MIRRPDHSPRIDVEQGTSSSRAIQSVARSVFKASLFVCLHVMWNSPMVTWSIGRSKILCLPPQGVQVTSRTSFWGCSSSCSAPCSLSSVTSDSPETEGSVLVPRMSIGGVLEKLLGLWSGTARASESVGQSWVGVYSLKPVCVGCLMA